MHPYSFDVRLRTKIFWYAHCYSCVPEVHMTAESIIEMKEEKLNICTNCGESCFLAV